MKKQIAFSFISSKVFSTIEENFRRRSCFFLVLCLFVPCTLHAWLAEDIEDLAREAGNLEALYSPGGFNYIYEKEDGCLVVGVGTSSTNDFGEARKLALTRAISRLIEALNGSMVETKQRSRMVMCGDSLQKEMVAAVEKSVSGKLDKVRIRGYWIRNGVFSIVACRYINLPMAVSKDDFSAYAEEMKLAPAWVDALAYCRDIWIGGVKPIYNAEEDRFYLAAIVSVKNNTNPVRRESILRVTAAREIVKYQSGADFREELQSVKQIVTCSGSAGEEIVGYSSLLKKESQEQIHGSVGMIKKVGSFTHKITGRYYVLFVAELSGC